MNFNVFYIQFRNDLWEERYKFIILLFLYVFQVITSIITIFYMEELLALFEFDFISPTPPTGEAAFLDFFGDQLLFGIVIMALGTMNIFASNIENGSISFSLSRPISRSEYTLARIVARIIALVTPFFIAALIGWLYMGITFEIFPLDRLIWALIPLGLLFIYFGVITSAISTRTSALIAGLIAIVIFIVEFTISAFEPLELLSPITLSNVWIDILTYSTFQFDQEFVLKMALLGGWITIPLVLGIYSLNTRDL